MVYVARSTEYVIEYIRAKHITFLHIHASERASARSLVFYELPFAFVFNNPIHSYFIHSAWIPFKKYNCNGINTYAIQRTTSQWFTQTAQTHLLYSKHSHFGSQVRATQPPKNVGRTTKTESRTSISMIYRVNGLHKLWLCLVLLANSKRADSKRCWIYGSEFISSTLLAFYRKNVSCAPDPPSLVPVSLPLSRIVGLLSAVVAFTFEYCRVCVTLDAVLPARMNGSICEFQEWGGFDALNMASFLCLFARLCFTFLRSAYRAGNRLRSVVWEALDRMCFE